MAKMTYQQARRIRNRDYSLANLITRNIRTRDMGAGAAIKEAFKEQSETAQASYKWLPALIAIQTAISLTRVYRPNRK